MNMYGYTQHIENHYWGYFKQVNHKTIQQLQTAATNASETEIDTAIEHFRQEYTCSARRYLMNYFQKRASAEIPQLHQYSFVWSGNVYLFSMVDDVVVCNLNTEERDQYIQLICEIAASNHGDPISEWRPLIRKAMLWNKRIELIDKEDAFRIGHGLHFNLEEMNDFLLRVLDNEDLSYRKAEDVIEAFCFLYAPANNWHTANALKAEYAARTIGITARALDDKPMDFTVAVEKSLKSRVCNWKACGRNVQESFMEWLVARAPFMNLPSKKATNLYRRLTNFSYEVMTEQRFILNEKDLMPELLAYCSSDIPKHSSAVSAYDTAAAILSNASLEFDNLRKRQPEQVWRYLTVDKKGRTTAVAIGARIPNLLLGKEEVTKADLLFMLWYLCDLCWLENSRDVGGHIVADRIADYWSTAENLLESARLPVFYAPHMLERCFLKSICSIQSVMENPFEVYEGMCEFVLPEKQVRIRGKQGSKSEKSRATLEKEAMEAFMRNEIDFEGIECLMAQHLMIHGAKGKKYIFSREGISSFPDPEIIISYPAPETGRRFDQSNSEYAQQRCLELRFRFIYGLSLYLTEIARNAGVVCEFRTNYQKNVSLTVLKWDSFQ